MNAKYIPTKKLTEILNSHHTTGIDGADYGPLKEELEAALWSRQSKVTYSDPWDEYEAFLDSEGVPPVPEEIAA